MGLGNGFKGVCQECGEEKIVFPIFRNGKTDVVCDECLEMECNKVVVK